MSGGTRWGDRSEPHSWLLTRPAPRLPSVAWPFPPSRCDWSADVVCDTLLGHTVPCLSPWSTQACEEGAVTVTWVRSPTLGRRLDLPRRAGLQTSRCPPSVPACGGSGAQGLGGEGDRHADGRPQRSSRHNNRPETGWLKQQKCVSSQSWRWGIKSRVVTEFGCGEGSVLGCTRVGGALSQLHPFLLLSGYLLPPWGPL